MLDGVFAMYNILTSPNENGRRYSGRLSDSRILEQKTAAQGALLIQEVDG